MSALPRGQHTKPFGGDELTCRPHSSGEDSERTDPLGDKRKEGKQKYPPPRTLLESPQLCHPPTNAIPAGQLYLALPTLPRRRNATNKNTISTNPTQQAMIKMLVCLSSICQDTDKVTDLWLLSTIISERYLGTHLIPQMPDNHHNVVLSHAILPGVSPSQNKPRVLNQV